MEKSQPIAVESPLEQSDNCPNKVDSSESTTIYGSAITMALCLMVAAFM